MIWLYFESKFYCEFRAIKKILNMPTEIFENAFSLKCVDENKILFSNSKSEKKSNDKDVYCINDSY